MSDELSYGYKTTVQGGLDEVENKVRDALSEEGFGVLTEIDIQEAFKEKLGVDFRPYRILGACNPSIAHQAVSEEIDVGLLLPCNVVVYAGDDPGTTVVAALDPVQQLGVAGRDDMKEMAQEAGKMLQRAVQRLESA